MKLIIIDGKKLNYMFYMIFFFLSSEVNKKCDSCTKPWKRKNVTSKCFIALLNRIEINIESLKHSNTFGDKFQT